MVINILFIKYAFELYKKYSDAQAKKLFFFSIIYLVILFAGMGFDVLIIN